MVEVQVVCAAVRQHARGYKGVDKKEIKRVGSVEVIRLARTGHVGSFLPGKFLQRPEDGVRTAGAQGGVKRKVGHEVGADILHAGVSTEIDAHERTDYLTGLIAE